MPTSPYQKNYRFWVKLCTYASVGVAGTLLLLKSYAWYVSDSASMLASLTDSLLDVIASLFTFFAVRIAVQPADDEHRFGHGKVESLAALAQAAFITGSAFLLIIHSADALLHSDNTVVKSTLAIQVSVIAIVLTLALITLQKIAVSKTQSKAIAADALHFTSDLLLNSAVIVALLLNQLGFVWVDSAMAILIALFLMFSAIKMGIDAFHSLIDRELDDKLKATIIEQVCATQGVLGVHDLRTRESGSVKFVQLHIELGNHLTLLEAHKIADNVEQHIKAFVPGADVIVHMDPLAAMSEETPNFTDTF